MSVPSLEAFASMVNERSAPGYRYDSVDSIEVEAKADGSRMSMRTQGGFITRCALLDKDGKMVDVLYCGPDLNIGKLNASHAMSPVGPWDGIGGQHGYARWVDYAEGSHTAEGLPHDEGYFSDERATSAKAPAKFLGISRAIEIESLGSEPGFSFDIAHITTGLQNSGNEDVWTSLGEHLYFNLPHGDAQGLLIGTTIANMAKPANLDEIMAGNAHFLPSYNGEVFVAFPNGTMIKMKSNVFDGEELLSQKEMPLGMRLWHRQGTESICIEPTVGARQDQDGGIRNNLLRIPPNDAVYIHTQIKLYND